MIQSVPHSKHTAIVIELYSKFYTGKFSLFVLRGTHK